MYTIQCLNSIADKGLALLQPPTYQLVDDQADAILLRSHSLHDMSILSTLKAIARAGAGTDNLPIARLTDHGIPVFNTPGANANAVKELTVAGILLGARQLCQAYHATRELRGEDVAKQAEQLKKQYRGFELPGKTLGIVGLGAIGVMVANAAVSLGMRVMAYDPMLTVDNAWRLASEVKKAEALSTVIEQADLLSLHLPLTKQTRGLLNQDNLTLLKRSAILLNFSRAAIVDDTALLATLNDSPGLQYITDFPNQQLLAHPQVLCLPHLGASTVEAEENCAVMAVEHLKDFLETGTINQSVNFPSTNLPLQQGPRLTVVNRNVPNMVNQITAIISKSDLNIIDMTNRSRDDIAYTVIDVATQPSPLLLDAITTIDGVIKVRLINV